MGRENGLNADYISVTGRELKWFLCYMTGGRQCVVWDGTVRTLINVLYGVRQGSILGPLLFIILVSGMAKFLGVEEGENVVYADDSNVWQTGNNVEEVVRKLTEKAALFVDYTRSMGLSMNATKTQLLLSAKAGNVSKVTVEVDGNTILPCNVIELLGVRYDRKLLTTPHVRSMLAAVRQRASVVVRLANHLPRGTYLRQLSYGLVMGKFAHALAAVAKPRLDHEDNTSVIWSRIQVAFKRHGQEHHRRTSEFGPSQRGWTFCPARARPSWIIRGACPLHYLKKGWEAGGGKEFKH
jgi:hypothetical protein